MFIAVYYPNSFSILSPWFGLLVEVHVMFRASDNNLSFVSIELQLVSVGIVGDDVQGTLQATGAVGEQVGIISDTDSSCTDRTEIKTKVGAVE